MADLTHGSLERADAFFMSDLQGSIWGLITDYMLRAFLEPSWRKKLFQCFSDIFIPSLLKGSRWCTTSTSCAWGDAWPDTSPLLWCLCPWCFTKGQTGVFCQQPSRSAPCPGAQSFPSVIFTTTIFALCNIKHYKIDDIYYYRYYL